VAEEVVHRGIVEVILKFPDLGIAQCLANITAWLEWHGLPPLFTVAAMRDRAVFRYDQPFIDRMQLMATAGLMVRWDLGIRKHGLTARCGWRERVTRCSAQVIEHRDGVEVDFDLFNPDMGAGPAIGHALECLWPGKTDPFRVRRGLIGRGLTVPLVEV
jgi:hypothetical protein